MDNHRLPESVPDVSFDNYADKMIHQRLSTIFRERCHSDSSLIKEFLRAPEYSDQSYIIDQILTELDLSFIHFFSKAHLMKLSLLWNAVLGSCHNSAELLVRSGADVNELYGSHVHHCQLELNTKSTVLHALLYQMNESLKNERLIRLVIDHGADLQARDSKGRTALHIAVMKAPVQMAELLLEKGADVNIADDKGKTPLLVVAGSSKADKLVPLLMKHGADVLVKDAHGKNVLHRLSSAPVEYVDLARVLIEKGVSLDDRDYNQYQPIHLAAQKSYNKLVKLYLDHGADVNSLVNDLNVTPLHIAAMDGNAALMEMLITCGADIHKKTDREGHTALHTACRYPTIDQKNIRPLLSAGADILIEDMYGFTPFALLNRHNHYVASTVTQLMVKKLALIKVCKPTIELKDEKIIERFQVYRNYFRNCIDQIERMKSTKFIETCTFFDLLTKRHYQIAALMRNPDFETKFKLYDLSTSKLSTYSKDLFQAFERAQVYYRSMLELEDMIDEAVYYTLPCMVVRKVVHYMLN